MFVFQPGACLLMWNIKILKGASLATYRSNVMSRLCECTGRPALYCSRVHQIRHCRDKTHVCPNTVYVPLVLYGTCGFQLRGTPYCPHLYSNYISSIICTIYSENKDWHLFGRKINTLLFDQAQFMFLGIQKLCLDN